MDYKTDSSISVIHCSVPSALLYIIGNSARSSIFGTPCTFSLLSLQCDAYSLKVCSVVDNNNNFSTSLKNWKMKLILFLIITDSLKHILG